MTTQLLGSCLCGQVAYEVNTTLKQFYFCHCQQCRKLTGSAHASNILAELADINWLKGQHNVKRYDAGNGRSFTHVFCSECGSGLPFHDASDTTLFIPAGSLDSPSNISVTRNIFWEEAPKWYKDGLTAQRCSQFPEHD